MGMANYYTALQSRTQALLLERRMKSEGVDCDLTYIPRPISTDLCNMGVKFEEREMHRAINSIKRSGLPGCKVYKEIYSPRENQYIEIDI